MKLIFVVKKKIESWKVFQKQLYFQLKNVKVTTGDYVRLFIKLFLKFIFVAIGIL